MLIATAGVALGFRERRRAFEARLTTAKTSEQLADALEKAQQGKEQSVADVGHHRGFIGSGGRLTLRDLRSALPAFLSDHRAHLRRGGHRTIQRGSTETSLRPSTVFGLRAPHDYEPGARLLRIRDDNDRARFGHDVPITDRARKAIDARFPCDGIIFPEFGCREAQRRWTYPARLGWSAYAPVVHRLLQRSSS